MPGKRGRGYEGGATHRVAFFYKARLLVNWGILSGCHPEPQWRIYHMMRIRYLTNHIKVILHFVLLMDSSRSLS